jgi:ribonuclease P protein component
VRGEKRFPRECRLLRRAEFDAVYRDGRRRASKQFVVFFLPHAASTDVPAARDAKPSRFGASVKRALGNAVVRNRIRRRIREILRLHRQEFSAGWDIVIHPRSSVATAPFASLAEELTHLIRTAVGPATRSQSE